MVTDAKTTVPTHADKIMGEGGCGGRFAYKLLLSSIVSLVDLEYSR